MDWKQTQNLIYHIPKTFKYTSNIAIFNFIDTLIKVNKHSIKFTFSSVPHMLYNLYSKNASIIIYQSFSDNDIDHIKYTYSKFLNKIKEIVNTNNDDTIGIDNDAKLRDIPIMVFFSTGCNKFKKPCTGLWQMINVLYNKKHKSIDLKKCIMVGHLAGRLDLNKVKKDKSVDDRAFAHNINMKFSTPSGFFENDKIKYKSQWEWDRNVLSENEKKYLIKNTTEIPDIFKKLYDLHKSYINNLECYIIIITGLPFCGKTTLCKYLKKTWDEHNLSNNDLSTNDLSTNDLSNNDLSTNDLSTNDLSTNDLSTNDLSTNDLSNNDLSTNDCIVLSDSSLSMEEIPIQLTGILNHLYNNKDTTSSNKRNSETTNTGDINNIYNSDDIYSKKVIIIDVVFDYVNILKILKIIALYKLYILIVKPNSSNKFIKLLNFISAEKNNKKIIKKYDWRNYHNKLNKLSNIKILNYIDYIDTPIIPVLCKEFWYEYSY
jgi:DNA 3'-phosphatase